MSTSSNPLNLSDAEFINAPEPEELNVAPEDTSTEKVENTAAEDTLLNSSDESMDSLPETPEETTDTSPKEQEPFNKDDSDTEEVTDESEDENKESDESADTSEKDEDTEEKEEDTEKAEASDEKTNDEPSVNYEEEYKKLLAPFRANGKEMQIGSVDDAISLMKMGANYTKKMAALKPNLKLMKMLQNNDLLDEEKLSYLIDLDKKHPEAVQKFVKESGIDPLDLDEKEDTDYTPNTYTVNDKEVELDAILDDIRDTESFSRTIDIIGNKWDADSKKILLETPALIKVINNQVANGIFDKITDVIESERMLGRLQGISDLAAYKTVGEAIQAKGGFDSTPSSTKQTTTNSNLEATPNTPKSQDDPKLKNRKRAASVTRSAPGGSKKEDYNPLALSDADFEKATSNDFI